MKFRKCGWDCVLLTQGGPFEKSRKWGGKYAGRGECFARGGRVINQGRGAHAPPGSWGRVVRQLNLFIVSKAGKKTPSSISALHSSRLPSGNPCSRETLFHCEPISKWDYLLPISFRFVRGTFTREAAFAPHSKKLGTSVTKRSVQKMDTPFAIVRRQRAYRGHSRMRGGVVVENQKQRDKIPGSRAHRTDKGC